MESIRRKIDENSAEITAQFLDQYFYPITQNFERVTDKDRQVKGMDTIFDLNGFHYICDEKSATSYVNRKLETFSLELAFVDRGGLYHDGWLLDESKENNSFLFAWIPWADNDTLQSKGDIRKFDIAVVRKTAILDYLAKKGATTAKLREFANDMMNGMQINASIERNGYKLVLSRHLFEQPINIIIPKAEYMKMSDITYRIYVK